MAFEFKFPDVGEGITEGEVVRWLVQEGERVKEDQTLVEVETDKAIVELPSPRAGVILKILFQEGQIVKVGQTLVIIGEEGEVIPEAVEAAPAEAKVAEAGVKAERRGLVLATPSTRKLARELGVDISQIEGSGPGGRITAEDVKAFAASLARAKEKVKVVEVAEKPVPVKAPSLEERVPLRGVRRRTAEKMVQSKHTAPHVTHIDEADVTELVKLREELKPLEQEYGIKLSYLPFIIKALIPALKKYPYLNASLDQEKEEIVLKKYYNIGIATATEDGLIVPVVKDADKKSILELAKEIEKLTEQTRSRKISLEDLKGGTFSITNYGSIGGLLGTPIINYPEVAILGIGRIQQRPVLKDGEIQLRYMLYLSLSFDHRVLDGAVAAEFTNLVIRYLENPKLLFMEMI